MVRVLARSPLNSGGNKGGTQQFSKIAPSRSTVIFTPTVKRV
jgi:hypothetical protein